MTDDSMLQGYFPYMSDSPYTVNEADAVTPLTTAFEAEQMYTPSWDGLTILKDRLLINSLSPISISVTVAGKFWISATFTGPVVSIYNQVMLGRGRPVARHWKVYGPGIDSTAVIFSGLVSITVATVDRIYQPVHTCTIDNGAVGVSLLQISMGYGWICTIQHALEH